MRNFIIASSALALTACSTIDWRAAGRDFVTNACEDAGNCEVVCPDGTATDPRFPRCGDPTVDPRAEPWDLAPSR